MAFILVFVVALLVLPVWIDIERHGPDNILRKSAQDVLRFRWVVALQEVLRSFTRVVTASLSVLVIVYIIYKVVQYIFNALAS